ncbi:MAG: GTP-binding protein [Candidatus Eremiobacteraeota bacterium]|nr:GTP-binding protein [Candidatus Eremiobacteraeota bacterium]
MISKKVCMLGAFAVGKTSLVARFVTSMFSDKYHTTVGVKVDKKELEVDGQPVKMMLWDLAGKDDFTAIPTSYLKGMSGYLLVVDSTRAATLSVALEVRQTVERELGELPCILLVNKIDLTDDYDLDQPMLESLNCPLGRTSCKTGEGVEEAFLSLARAML